MMIAEKAGFVTEKAETEWAAFRKHLLVCTATDTASALKTFLEVFARTLWVLPSLFRVHTSAQGEDYLSPYILVPISGIGFIDCFI